ncbi:MAG: indole-3-glycerol phosphate synthase TrpC [Rikenellaceae bacterium]
MEDILKKIVADKRSELSTTDFGDVRSQAFSCSRPVISMSEALRSSSSGIIAEFKRRSPSKGWIFEGADPREVVSGYSRVGAAACSVLTNEKYFGGSLADLRLARSVAGDMPLLRKEFIVDERQIYEARVSGADAVLLIASCLSRAECSYLAEVAHSVGLEVLLEIHTQAELDYVDVNIDMLGVNNRNLGTFHTDLNNSFALAQKMRERAQDITLVSESGIDGAQTIMQLRAAGFRGFLIGETFMKTGDPSGALQSVISQLC